MEYIIRPLDETEYSVLESFLYEAIFVPDGVSAPSRDIIRQPDLQVYLEGFGSRKGDAALCAVYGGSIVGAVWGRIMNDYGHIDDDTPSLAISLYKEYRNQGIGTELLRRMILLLRQSGYKQVSLSVQKANYAARMYLNAGFKVVNENPEEYIMALDL